MPPYPDSEGLQVNVDNGGLEYYNKPAEPTRTPVPYYKEDTVVEEPSAKQDRKICGLARRTFWIVFAVVAIVIVAAAVGGGVGGSLAGKNTNKSEDNQSPSSTPPATPTSSDTPTSSSTPTSSVVPTGPVPTSGLLPLDCPAINATTYSSVPRGSSSNYTYMIHCDVNYNGADLVKTKTNSLELCMDACAEQSNTYPLNPCGLVVWIGNLTLAISKTDGNCYLKAAVVTPNEANPTDRYAGAVWINT